MSNFCLFMDGNAWCAVGPGFVDIMASPCGFGDTQGDAIKAFQKAWRRPGGNQRDLTLSDFIVCDGDPSVGMRS
jgi:hypothetical protein